MKISVFVRNCEYDKRRSERMWKGNPRVKSSLENITKLSTPYNIQFNENPPKKLLSRAHGSLITYNNSVCVFSTCGLSTSIVVSEDILTKPTLTVSREWTGCENSGH